MWQRYQLLSGFLANGHLPRVTFQSRLSANDKGDNEGMAVPVLMYGSKNWSLNGSDKRKIEAAEMRFLRPTAGYTLWDKKEVAT